MLLPLFLRLWLTLVYSLCYFLPCHYKSIILNAGIMDRVCIDTLGSALYSHGSHSFAMSKIGVRPIGVLSTPGHSWKPFLAVMLFLFL